MKCAFNQQISALRLYLKQIMLEGIDLSALYIVQAQLTNLRVAVRPATVMLSLFSQIELSKMLVFTKEYFLRRMQSNQKGDTVYSMDDNLNRFDVSVDESERNSVQGISIICEQILVTLEEWQHLELKTQRIKSKLDSISDYGGSFYGQVCLKQEIEYQLKLMDVIPFEEDLKLLAESTECFSSLEESELTYKVRPLRVSDICAIFHFVVAWSRQIVRQIKDFSIQLKQLKEESSVDFQHEKETVLGRKSLISISSPQKLKRHREKSINIYRLTEVQSKRSENENLYGYPARKVIKNDLKSRKLISFSSLRSRDASPQKLLKIRCDMTISGVPKSSQILSNGSEKTCQKCLIY